jgi:hypothetical protein
VVDAIESETRALEAVHHSFESGAASLGQFSVCVEEPSPSLFGDRVADEKQVHGASLLLEPGELQARWFDEALLSLQVRARERMSGEPFLVEGELELVALRADMRKRDDLGVAIAVEEHRKAKQRAQALGGRLKLLREGLEIQIIELSAMASNERSHQGLLVAAKTWQV